MVPGKIILAGEYSVLDGGAAIVLPLPARAGGVSLAPGSSENRSLVIPQEFWIHGKDVLEIPDSVQAPTVYNSLPLGAGLGSSAALSVLLVKWWMGKSGQNFDPETIQRLAHQIEQAAHGRSSGADVAGVMASGPIIYQMGRSHSLAKWKDCLTLVISPPLARQESAKALIQKPRTPPPKFDKSVIESWGSWQSTRIREWMVQQAEWFKAENLWTESALQIALHWETMGVTAIKPSGAGGGGVLIGIFDQYQAENVPPKVWQVVRVQGGQVIQLASPASPQISDI